MADAAYATDITEEDEAAGGDEEGLITPETLAEWAESSVNIAEQLDKTTRAAIGDRVVRDYETDLVSRVDKEKAWKAAVDIAKQVTKRRQYPWAGASNIQYPALTTAAIQFAARSYPAIVDSTGVVKGRVVGYDKGIQAKHPESGEPVFLTPDGQPVPISQNPETGEPFQPAWEQEPGAKQALADRIAEHMSYQLLEEMEEWEEDTDKLLHTLPIYGCAFRKTWFDPELGRNRSKLVLPDDLVVNIEAESLERAPRVTEHVMLYKAEVTERQRLGIFIDEDVLLQQDEDSDPPHLFLEQHMAYDLDEDGYPEPYIATVQRDTGQLLRLVARFDPDGIQMVETDDEIAKIDPVTYYTKYPFIPSPDGCFYDLGFADLLLPLNKAINSTLNQLMDAGHLANLGGGFISDELEIKAGNNRFRPGEWKRAGTFQGKLGDAILPLPTPEPSVVLFQLLEKLIDAAQEISGVQDIMTGNMPQNQTATATRAVIEQGLKVFTAIHKRIYRALKSEFKKLRRLNSMYLDEQMYAQVMDNPQATGQDYANAEFDIVPTADPSMITDTQRAAKAEVLMQFKDDPYFNPREIRERFLSAISITDIDDVLVDQPPQNPEVMMEQAKMELEGAKFELEQDRVALEGVRLSIDEAEIKSKIILNLAKAEAEEDGTQIAFYTAQMQALTKQSSNERDNK